MNAGFSCFLLDQFSLGGSDFSSFVRVWKEVPIKSFIFCNDIGSTTIKLFQWHEIGVFKSYTNSCCVSSQHFWVRTTPVTRSSETYYLAGCPGEKKTSERLWRYKPTSFVTPLAYFALMMCKTQRNNISTLLLGLQNSSKLRQPHVLAPINGIYIPKPYSILTTSVQTNQFVNVTRNSCS